jgi:ADP-ribosylglycohydrolase
LRRARIVLEGLSVGDAFGELFFGPDELVRKHIAQRKLPSFDLFWTDDTNMALSIFSVLRACGQIDQDRLARSFGRHFSIGRGYGPMMRELLPALDSGGSWRELAPAAFDGHDSFGNGSAMRVAPLGAYFADNMDAAVENARRSSEVTHAHPEAVAGAIAVAAATAVATNLRGKPVPRRAEFIERVLPHVPGGVVKTGLERARTLRSRSVRAAVRSLGNGSQISCQDTVPWVLWCAGEKLADYSEALWLTVSGGGDVDTTCATVGAIVSAYTGREGIPRGWLDDREPLPDWAFTE